MADEDARHRYQILMNYLATEGQIFWSRSQLFLVASAALLGFVTTRLPPVVLSTPWDQIITVGVGAFGGLCLCRLWHRALKAGNFWIDRWEHLLTRLEPEAFGDLEVRRNVAQRPGGPARVSSRQVAFDAVWLFVILWSLVLLYLFWVGSAKVCGPAFPLTPSR
jgi:hypothetical protein